MLSRWCVSKLVKWLGGSALWWKWGLLLSLPQWIHREGAASRSCCLGPVHHRWTAVNLVKTLFDMHSESSPLTHCLPTGHLPYDPAHDP